MYLISFPSNALTQIKSFVSTILAFDLGGNITSKAEPNGKIALSYDALSCPFVVRIDDRYPPAFLPLVKPIQAQKAHGCTQASALIRKQASTTLEDVISILSLGVGSRKTP